MLDRERVRQILSRLNWSRGFDREELLRQLLERNLALPNEFLSAVSPVEVYRTPDQLLSSVPDVVWTIHAERERRARGPVQSGEATRRALTARVQ
jgi:hypothetical protein